jgi:predicted GNAT family acetyltransferase
VPEHLENMHSDGLLPAMDSNLGAFWSCYGRAEGCTLHADPAVTWFYAGIQFSLFNGVSIIDTDQNGVNRTFEDLQAKIATQGAPALWWISPLSKPDNIGSLLEQHGVEPVGEVPAMAINLEDLDGRLDSIPGFTCQKVDGAEMQALWGRIAAIGNGCDEGVINAMEKTESTIDASRYRAQRRYIGYLDGEPVASTALVLDAGVAGIYAVATVPEARKKGIGRFLTVMPLLEAKEMGYRVGILQSSSAGYSIYQRIGFTEVFRYRLYLQS